MKLIEEMKEEKKNMAKKKITYIEKMMIVQQEKLRTTEQEKVQLKQMKEEQKIMLINKCYVSNSS